MRCWTTAPAVITGANNVAEVARRHDQGQAGPFRQNLLGKLGRLFRSFGDRGRPTLRLHQCGLAQEDGSGAVQTVHLRQAANPGMSTTIKAAKKMVEREETGGLGHPGRGDPRASGTAEPCAHLAPPGYPGIRTD